MTDDTSNAARKTGQRSIVGTLRGRLLDKKSGVSEEALRDAVKKAGRRGVEAVSRSPSACQASAAQSLPPMAFTP